DVGCDRPLMSPIGRHTETSLLPGPQSLLPHQPGYPVPAHRLPRFTQFDIDAGTSVVAAACLVPLLDLRRELAIAGRSPAFRPTSTGVVPGPRNLEYPTHQRDRIVGLLCLDRRESH